MKNRNILKYTKKYTKEIRKANNIFFPVLSQVAHMLLFSPGTDMAQHIYC